MKIHKMHFLKEKRKKEKSEHCSATKKIGLCRVEIEIEIEITEDFVYFNYRRYAIACYVLFTVMQHDKTRTLNIQTT